MYYNTVIQLLFDVIIFWGGKPGCRPYVTGKSVKTLFLAQTSFIKLCATFKGDQSYGCSEVAHILMAFQFSQIWDETFQATDST